MRADTVRAVVWTWAVAFALGAGACGSPHFAEPGAAVRFSLSEPAAARGTVFGPAPVATSFSVTGDGPGEATFGFEGAAGSFSALIAAGLGLLGVLVPSGLCQALALAGGGLSLFMLLVYLHPFYAAGILSSALLLAALLSARWTVLQF